MSGLNSLPPWPLTSTSRSIFWRAREWTTSDRIADAVAVLIGRALQQTGNNVSAAARLLGVSRDFLRYRLGGNKPDSTSGE